MLLLNLCDEGQNAEHQVLLRCFLFIAPIEIRAMEIAPNTSETNVSGRQL